MHVTIRKAAIASAALAIVAASIGGALAADKKYDTGATKRKNNND